MLNVISRKTAIKNGLKKYYTGVKCSRGHLSERTVYDRHCILCKRIRQKKHYIKYGPRKQNIKSHMWSRLNHIKLERKSKFASTLDFNKNDFFRWFDMNYKGKCYYCEISFYLLYIFPII